MFSYVLAVLAGLISGFGVFVTIINRIMGRLVDGWKKDTVSVLLFIGIMGGFATAAIWLVSSSLGWLMVIPVVILLLFEGYRILSTGSYRAAPPVAVESAPRTLLRPITTTDLQICRYEVRVEDAPFEHLRVAFISDLHINESIPYSYYQMVIEQVNLALPDVILIGGDYITEPGRAAL